MTINEEFSKYKRARKKDKFIENIEKEHKDDEIYITVFKKLVESLLNTEEILYFHQEVARKDNCAIVRFLNENNIQEFGLFAYEGEDDDVIADMADCGYQYMDTKDIIVNERLFIRIMCFMQEPNFDEQE